MKTLYMIRGISGSGKTTYAKNNCGDIRVFEADQFFTTIDETGTVQYKFNPALLSFAHQHCLSRVVCELFHNDAAIVANTFTTNWEMEKYFKLKEIFPDLEIKVIEMKTQYKNVHGVPEEKVEQMKRRWEEIDKKYIESGVVSSVDTFQPINVVA